MSPTSTPPPHPAQHPTGPDLPLTPLSENLAHLLERAQGQPLSVATVIEVLHGRGFNLLLVFFCLPFCLPVSIPGLSTPFGLAILLLGLRIALRREPWLPQRILNARIPFDALQKIVGMGVKLSTWMERWVRPRARTLAADPGLVRLNGLSIVIAALALMVPLPVPLANFFPAWAIVLVALGLMEEDGACIIAGHVLCITSWLYFLLLWWLGMAGVEQFLGR